MRLFNASSMFNENAEKEIAGVLNKPEELKKRVIDIKRNLISSYNFKAYNAPDDFTAASYIIATNHLTDSDAPLIMSYYYSAMHEIKKTYPSLFVFAKENCFNGVSIPKELMPILELESVFAVDRNSIGGSMAAMRAAEKWFAEGEKPQHFLIFSQGTIYDINKDKAEDIEPGAFWLSKMLNIPVLPAFIEQAVEGEENRLIFGRSFIVSPNCRNYDEYKQLWLDRVIEAQNNLETLTGIPARKTVLDEEHQKRKRFKVN
jgi:hypothetical protein